MHACFHRVGLRTIVHGLKIVHQGQDIPVAHRYSFQYRDLISDHVFSPGHEPLVDNFGSIVSPCVDVHAFLDHRIAASAQSLAGLVSAWLHLRLRLGRMCSRSSVRSHIRRCNLL